MTLTLVRTANTPDGVFGLLRLGAFTFFTVEDDWKNNAPGESCIPAGTYQLERSFYHKGGYEAFEITGVPGRSRILIHVANTEEDVRGCVGLGMRVGVLRVPDEDNAGVMTKKRAVVESAEAFRRFMRAMAGIDQTTIAISWAEGLP